MKHNSVCMSVTGSRLDSVKSLARDLETKREQDALSVRMLENESRQTGGRIVIVMAGADASRVPPGCVG